jgi:hypothetical protein
MGTGNSRCRHHRWRVASVAMLGAEKLNNMYANKSDEPNPAIAPRFQAGVIAAGSLIRERSASPTFARLRAGCCQMEVKRHIKGRGLSLTRCIGYMQ